MKEVLASWTAEFQHEANFAPIRQLYDSLRREGVSFIPQVCASVLCPVNVGPYIYNMERTLYETL